MHASSRSLVSRRSALLGLTSAVAFGRNALALSAAPTDHRFVVIILRGALDGLAAVAPYGDPALATLRPSLIPPRPGTEGGMGDLGGFYGLHPAMPGTLALFRAGEALPIHAVAVHMRTRSHFEAQDLMESGADQRMSSGWLNRAVLAMPARPANGAALSVGVALPLLLLGPALVGAYAPTSFASPQADLYAKLVVLHQTDSVTGPAIRQGLTERGFTAEQLAGAPAPEPKEKYSFPTLAGTAGRLLAAADGPRVAALELEGWDTHANQAQRLLGPLGQLDRGLVALKDGLGAAWAQTAVLVMTEFGRTVRTNGTGGTDHGTGAVAFVVGGAVHGGRVQATWPGLSPGKLLEDRDLDPTLDLRSVAKGLLAAHLGLNGPALAQVFPGSEGAPPLLGLIRPA